MPGSYEEVERTWKEYCDSEREGKEIFISIAHYLWDERHRANNDTVEMLRTYEHEFFDKLNTRLSTFNKTYKQENVPGKTLEEIEDSINSYLRTIDRLTSAYSSIEQSVQEQRTVLMNDIKTFLQNIVDQTRLRSNIAHDDAMNIW